MPQVDAVEPHRELSDFIRGPFNTFSGGIYDRDTVHLHHNDVRGFLAAAQTRYDLIQISPFGTATPPAAGGQALDAQYLYTAEGMRLALSRLTAGNPGGPDI
jgi:spermidine synthase